MSQTEPSPITDLVVTVTRVLQIRGDSEVGSASGFFYLNRERLFLVTNRHVVIDETKGHRPDALKIRVHTDPTNITRNIDIVTPLYEGTERRWLESEETNADVAAIELNRSEIEGYVIKAFSAANMPPNDVVIDLGESVLVLGYPLGFYDDIHNLPIIRNAILASVYPVPFRGNPYFLIDGRLHEGMSGSPIITKPSPIRPTKKGISFMGGPVTFLLGILSHTFPVPKGIEPLDLSAVWFASLVDSITR